jgi:hypothetical protein
MQSRFSKICGGGILTTSNKALNATGAGAPAR